MIDTHTHILPHMDDGADHLELSLRMLETEKAQGVDRVVLTPHCYMQHEEAADFLSRREKAYARLRAAVADRNDLPELILGAEVAWVPNMSEQPLLDRLCIGNSRYLLLEMPMRPWNPEMLYELYRLQQKHGLTPVLAHIDRYFGCQKEEYLAELLHAGYPAQVSAESFLHFSTRRKSLKLLENGLAQILISDCHNLTDRAPNLDRAMAVIEKKLGISQRKLTSYAESIIY